MSVQQLADALRVEVNLIVGEHDSFGGEETRRVYLLLREQGIEHHRARHQALGFAIGTLRSRQVAAAANDHCDEALRWMVHAHAIEAAFLREIGEAA